MAKTVLVAGASGFIGSHLCESLVRQGYDVRAMTRDAQAYSGPGDPVEADVLDPTSLPAALEGADVAYYLVHSLDSDDFEDKDAAAACNFADAARAAGLRQLIYLGGLGSEHDDLSPHLRSRRQVEQLLGIAGVPLTVLRAAVVIGDGSISWEITRQLVDQLPMLLSPNWAKTRTQPIALRDAIRYLVGVLDVPEALGQIFEIGGDDVLTYLDMLQRAAELQGKSLPSLPVPLLSSSLSSLGLSLLTDVDQTTARNLIESMGNEVVVRDHAIERIVPGTPLGYDNAVRAALADREERLTHES
jgi:uncharacterized protein YbjT (DUF2867 family)